MFSMTTTVGIDCGGKEGREADPLGPVGIELARTKGAGRELPVVDPTIAD